jgi:hypothetical protein
MAGEEFNAQHNIIAAVKAMTHALNLRTGDIRPIEMFAVTSTILE